MQNKGRSALYAFTGIALIAVVASVFMYQNLQAKNLELENQRAQFVAETPVQAPEPPKEPEIDTEVIHRLVNDYRASKGLPRLERIPELDASAQDKCEDMIEYRYWAHDNPITGATPWDFIKPIVDYYEAGENLTEGNSNNQPVVDAWIASKTHRENLEYGEYNYVGYAHCTQSYEVDSDSIDNMIIQHLISRPL